MSIAFLFPGQGSQYPGMLHSLPAHPVVHSTIKEASDILEKDVLTLDSEFTQNAELAVQLCLFIASVAVANALQQEGVTPDMVAGLSVGAFAAAVVCNSLNFADGLTVVTKRAQLMQHKFPSGYGMSAIEGLTEQRVAELVARIHTESNPVYLSNINAPLQIVVSGCNAGLDLLEKAALQSGARKVKRLPVTVPSHCALFRSEADILQQEMQKFNMAPPSVKYVGNVKARALRTAEAIAEDLATNVAHGVRWYDSVSVLVELGADLFIEMNPGSVLTRLGGDLFPEQRFIAAEESSIGYLSKLAASRK
ncbi:MAG TPA: malonate decarboxylase subunit epsilon [Planktothrix sp.]|jgi:malonate decarboxylase epsilon subunit